MGSTELCPSIDSALVVLTLVSLLPLSAAYIDCRISCRRCHENTEHPSVLEVYCAMCEECKQRRRERVQGRPSSLRPLLKGSIPLTPLVRMRDGYEESAEYTPPQLPSMVQQPSLPPQGQIAQQQAAPIPPQPANNQPQALGIQILPLARLSPLPQQQQALQPQQQPHAAAAQQQPVAPALLPVPPMQQVQRQAYDHNFGLSGGCPTPPLCSDSEEDMLTRPISSTSTTTPPPTSPACPVSPPCRKKRKQSVMFNCMPCMPMCPCPGYTPTPQMLQEADTPAHMDYHYLYIGLPKSALRS
ncbi:unnamed protein product [Chrysodeixis includens]|uniref:Uncharacterized protein n=1 Tax=Chrysodeixis includens TaxID=689277 RepID=A0A9N8L4M7_CHRIL|nr:unnamed protein product [Chrysodeixis includens]